LKSRTLGDARPDHLFLDVNFSPGSHPRKPNGGDGWEISMALHEETSTDPNLGRYMNHNCAEYHIPVNADIHDIDVIFVNEDDTISNPLGAKRTGRDRNRRQSSRRRERDLPHHC